MTNEMDGAAKGVVVTGAAGGIGRAAALRLAEHGWQVLAVDRDADGLRWTETVTNASSLTADVSSEADNASIAAEAERLYGGLDALILNAAVKGGGSIDDLSFDGFRRVIEINLFGAVLGLKAMLPLLRKRKNGAIAITSSTMGIAGDSENWAYTSSKHALIGLVRSLSREIAWEGIRINALCPGPTRGTGMTQEVEDLAAEHFTMMTQKVPLQRWADPDEMAAVLEFLVSPAASYVNGHAMVADGGAVVGTGLVGPATGEGGAMPGVADWKEEA